MRGGAWNDNMPAPDGSAQERLIHWLMERAMGIEPTSEAWEASILPLYDARSFL